MRNHLSQRLIIKCLTISKIELDLKMLVFEERGKPEYPEKNLSEQGREPTTNATHIWCRVRESNPGDRAEKRRSSFFHKFFTLDWTGLAILHQNCRGYICINIGQNVVQNIVHLYWTYLGIFEETIFSVCWSKSHLSVSAGPFFLKFRIHQILVSFEILFFSPSKARLDFRRSLGVLITGGRMSFFRPANPGHWWKACAFHFHHCAILHPRSPQGDS